MVQTADGYLWIGTADGGRVLVDWYEEGLARFDGMRFVVSDRQNAPALRSRSSHLLLTRGLVFGFLSFELRATAFYVDKGG
jgi:ligand-binding sensor domain-containing protein